MISRRGFIAGVGAGLLLPATLDRRVWAADSAARKLVIVNSLGTDNRMVAPTSQPGAALALQTANAPLMAVKQYINVIDGISFSLPTEPHGSPIPFTGQGYSGSGFSSIDQFIVKALQPTTRLPSVSLGATAVSGSRFYSGGQVVPPIDDPQQAFIAIFGQSGGAQAAADANASADANGLLPRMAILNELLAEVQSLRGTLGPSAQARLDQHLSALNSLAKGASPVATTATCQPQRPSAIGDGNVERADNALAIGRAHFDIILTALGCGVTQVATLQFGTNQTQALAYQGAPSAYDEHSLGVHGSPSATPSSTDVINGCESALAAAFATFVQGLASTPDPSGNGMLIDNTLVFWTRDFGYATNHTSYSIPTVFAGGTGYLKTSAEGVYTSFGGNDATATQSQVAHEALLYNCAEWMGVTHYQGFGRLTGAAQAPATAIKA